MCNYTITVFDFSGPPIPCLLQSFAITLSNLNGDFVRVEGLKDSFICGASPRAVQAPCDYCTAIVNAGLSRYATVYVKSGGGNVDSYSLSNYEQGFTKCPGFNIEGDNALLQNRQFFLIPTTCSYSSTSNTLECPGCNPSGTCMYSFRLDGQTGLCITSYPIEVSIHNDFDRNVGRGSGASAAFQGTRSQFEGGVSFVGRCVDFCVLGIQVFDTSCSYRVGQASVSGYNITRTFEVDKTLQPTNDIYHRNYDSVYINQCSRANPYPVTIGRFSAESVDIFIPRACSLNGSVTPAIITCPC